MTQIDGKINLVVFLNVYQTLLVLHVYCHKLVADLRSVFSVVHQTELFSLDV